MLGTPANAMFLSYRRFDSNAATHILHERLKATFGESAVFRDTERIEGGATLWETIRTRIDGCRAFVVLIHHGWLEVKESDGSQAGRRRLENPADHVRRELQYAFARPGLRIVPVLVDGASLPSAEVLEDLSSRDPELAGTLSALRGLPALPVRFDREFEADIGKLVETLAAVPGMVPGVDRGVFWIGGLEVLRTWALGLPRPGAGLGNACGRGSDLWILQARYRSTELLGREADLKELWSWLDAPKPVGARLLVGRAGSGKTRLGLEFLWQVERERGDSWDVGAVTRETLLHRGDWEAWNWRRPTLLLIDSAQSADRALRRFFPPLTWRLARKDVAPLRLLLLEREASTTEGWFKELLDLNSSVAGAPVRDLFLPPEPLSLLPIEAVETRRALLEETLRVASEHDGGPSPILPRPGTDPVLDTALEHQRWSDPLNLMMAALVARESVPPGIGNSNDSLRRSLQLSHSDLAREIARQELRRLDRFVPANHGESGMRLFRHLAAYTTATNGLSAEQSLEVTVEEMAALRIFWAEGPRDLVARLNEALPDEDDGVAPVQPDIVAEAFVLLVWSEGSISGDASALIQRCARWRFCAVAAMVLHGIQDFSQEEADARAWLCWLDALIGTGLDGAHDYFIAMGEEFPSQSVAWRLRAIQVRGTIEARLRGRGVADSTADAAIVSLAKLANHLGARLGQMRRPAEALDLARVAVELYRGLAERNPNRFTPDFAMSLLNLANRPSQGPERDEENRRSEALELVQQALNLYRGLADTNPDMVTPTMQRTLHCCLGQWVWCGLEKEALVLAEEAAKLYRGLAERNPDQFTPDFAMSLHNLAGLMNKLGRREEALATSQEAVQHYRILVARNPAAFTPDLAMLLRRLAELLGEAGRRQESLALAEELVKLYRSLAAKNRCAFTLDLTRALLSLAFRLSELDRWQEALVRAGEAAGNFPEYLPGKVFRRLQGVSWRGRWG